MKQIKILDEKLVSKIAAGEVIENPSSVVKELVENSLDANSDEITIRIEGENFDIIEIQDNGNGMNQENLELSLTKHATSKIENENDLFNIISLGFRGEALNSIASVSYMEIVTRQKNEEIGYKLNWDGFSQKITKTGCMTGTKIIVKNLFYNTPVRRKFLKSQIQEFAKILNLISKLALYNFDKSFKLYKNNKLEFESIKSKDVMQTLINVFGKDDAKEMIKIDYEKNGGKNGIEISGFISNSNLSLSNKNKQIIFVNKRSIKNKLISDSVYEGYHTYLMSRKHPVFFLKIEIDPKKIDVNVHPTKNEIRIENEELLFETIKNTIKETLNQKTEDEYKDENIKVQSYEKPLDFVKKPNIVKDNERIGDGRQEMRDNNQIKNNLYSQKILSEKKEEKRDVGLEGRDNEKKKIKKSKFEFRVLGQVLKCYILAETQNGFLVADQHALHERINYEKLMTELKNKKITKQKLVSPILINLSPTDSLVLKSNLDEMNSFGFDVEIFGENSFSVRSIPLLFGKEQEQKTINEIVNELVHSKKSKIVQNIKEKILTKMSCVMSIKQGEFLSVYQMTNLLNEFFNSDLLNTCPHGRPIIIFKTKDDLEKMFKRK
jgi:DNA mismatch repair protein MutL